MRGGKCAWAKALAICGVRIEAFAATIKRGDHVAGELSNMAASMFTTVPLRDSSIFARGAEESIKQVVNGVSRGGVRQKSEANARQNGFGRKYGHVSSSNFRPFIGYFPIYLNSP